MSLVRALGVLFALLFVAWPARALDVPALTARVNDGVAIGEGDRALVATLVTVEYATGEPETYVLPLAFVPKSDGPYCRRTASGSREKSPR